jgi:hypothetical protein
MVWKIIFLRKNILALISCVKHGGTLHVIIIATEIRKYCSGDGPSSIRDKGAVTDVNHSKYSRNVDVIENQGQRYNSE